MAEEHSFARVLAGARLRYGGRNNLDPTTLISEANSVLGDMAGSLARGVAREDLLALYEDLSPTEQEDVQRRMAARGVSDPQVVVSGGRFLEYAPRGTLLGFFESHPDLFFDGRYWAEPFSELQYDRPRATEEAHRQIVRRYAGLLTDVMWLAENDLEGLQLAGRSRVLRAVLAMEVLGDNLADALE